MADLKLSFIVLAMLLTGCALPQQTPPSVQVVVQTVVVTATATSAPTAAATEGVTPSPTAQAHPTQIPAITADVSPIKGTWRHITTADGLCTDTPILLGRGYIGTFDSTFCYPLDDTDVTHWKTLKIPIHARVIGMRPGTIGEGAHLMTSDGHCLWKPAEVFDGTDRFDCSQITTETALLARRSDGFHRRTETSIIIDNKVYSIPDIVNDPNARPTWSESSDGNRQTDFAEVWIGTNGFGLIVIDRDKGVIRRFTTADGLPSNTIRDVSNGEGPKPGTGYNIWVATDNGVARWDGMSWQIYGTQSGLVSDNVRGIAATKGYVEGIGWTIDVWIATDKGASYFDGHQWTSFTQSEGLPLENLTGVVNTGNIWFSTEGQGLVLFQRVFQTAN